MRIAWRRPHLLRRLPGNSGRQSGRPHPGAATRHLHPLHLGRSPSSAPGSPGSPRVAVAAGGPDRRRRRHGQGRNRHDRPHHRKVTSLHGLTYAELVKKHGKDRARLYGQANQGAIDQVERLVGELAIDCQFHRAPAFTYATRAEHRQKIEEEVATAVELGLPASLTETAALPFPIAAAVRFDD